MTLPLFTPDDVLPAGDYPMTLEELRNSHLVTGEGNLSDTWDPTKLQLPLWHKYRVEMYPHFGQPTGIHDKYGNNLLFPAAFRKSRIDHRPKDTVQVIK
jgi:hypothetical protein